MKEHNYIPRMAKVVKRVSLSPECLGLTLEFKDKKPFNFIPGQFVMASVFGFGEVPVGITSSPNNTKQIEIGVRSAGMVTQKLCGLMVGDEVGINGPLGNGFPLSRLKDRNVVIVSAGIGLFPLRSLIKYLEEVKVAKSVTVLMGYKKAEQQLYADEYESWAKKAKVAVALDAPGPDWKGVTGNITKLFDKTKIARGSVMIVCGPPVMYQPVIQRYAGKSIAETDLYFSLERRMKCGIGKCQHCTCGKQYVCLDGPVFNYSYIKYNPEAFV